MTTQAQQNLKNIQAAKAVRPDPNPNVPATLRNRPGTPENPNFPGTVQTPGDVSRAEQAKLEHDSNRPTPTAPRDRSYADRYHRIQKERSQMGPRSWTAHSTLLNVLATAKEGQAANMAKQVNPNGEQINALNNEARLLREIEAEFAHGPFDPFHQSVPRDQKGRPTNYQRGNSPVLRGSALDYEGESVDPKTGAVIPSRRGTRVANPRAIAKPRVTKKK